MEEGSPKRATIEFINASDAFIYDSAKKVKTIKFSSDLNLNLDRSIFYGSASTPGFDDVTNHLFAIVNVDYYVYANRKDGKYIYEVYLDYSILPDNIETDVVCHIEFPPVMGPQDITYEMVVPYKYLLKNKYLLKRYRNR